MCVPCIVLGSRFTFQEKLPPPWSLEIWVLRKFCSLLQGCKQLSPAKALMTSDGAERNIQLCNRGCQTVFPVTYERLEERAPTEIGQLGESYLAGMFRQLLGLFRKESGDQGETTPRQKEDDLLSSKTGRRKSFWGRLGECGQSWGSSSRRQV